ncbi:hypothetical protein JCM10021v2_002795 [Rhodotorula toruloides]
MAYATPRRPSAIPELASPSPSFTRRVSTASSLGGGGQSGSPSLGSGSERKRRTRLRDYYGLSTPRPGDGMDLDSPASFDANNYFQTLASTASLPELLKRETDLINGQSFAHSLLSICGLSLICMHCLVEIRELDGERQSLVYNHHGELISASDTIRKMKSRAEALDTSLDSLKTSFQSIAQLSASLAPTTASSTAVKPPASAPQSPRSPTEAPHTPRSSRRLAALPESPDSPTTPTQSRARSASQPPPPEPIRPFSPLIHLPALLALPILLRSLLSTGEKAKADSLWGSWEPALRSWEDEGVEGAREVGMECREVLRMQRRASVSQMRE